MCMYDNMASQPYHDMCDVYMHVTYHAHVWTDRQTDRQNDCINYPSTYTLWQRLKVT